MRERFSSLPFNSTPYPSPGPTTLFASPPSLAPVAGYEADSFIPCLEAPPPSRESRPKQNHLRHLPAPFNAQESFPLRLHLRSRIKLRAQVRRVTPDGRPSRGCDCLPGKPHLVSQPPPSSHLTPSRHGDYTTTAGASVRTNKQHYL